MEEHDPMILECSSSGGKAEHEPSGSDTEDGNSCTGNFQTCQYDEEMGISSPSISNAPDSSVYGAIQTPEAKMEAVCSESEGTEAIDREYGGDETFKEDISNTTAEQGEAGIHRSGGLPRKREDTRSCPHDAIGESQNVNYPRGGSFSRHTLGKRKMSPQHANTSFFVGLQAEGSPGAKDAIQHADTSIANRQVYDEGNDVSRDMNVSGSGIEVNDDVKMKGNIELTKGSAGALENTPVERQYNDSSSSHEHTFPPCHERRSRLADEGSSDNDFDSNSNNADENSHVSSAIATGGPYPCTTNEMEQPTKNTMEFHSSIGREDTKPGEGDCQTEKSNGSSSDSVSEDAVANASAGRVANEQLSLANECSGTPHTKVLSGLVIFASAYHKSYAEHAASTISCQLNDIIAEDSLDMQRFSSAAIYVRFEDRVLTITDIMKRYERVINEVNAIPDKSIVIIVDNILAEGYANFVSQSITTRAMNLIRKIPLFSFVTKHCDMIPSFWFENLATAECPSCPELKKLAEKLNRVEQHEKTETSPVETDDVYDNI